MTKLLIVNADDYGRTPGVSRGIREAHLRGLVTSTTAMMNIPGIEADLRRACETCPDLGLGVHLNLTAGTPVLPAEQIRSLVANAGRFPNAVQFAARMSEVQCGELKAEWRAQIEKFCDIVGRPPDHLDSHHHTAYFAPTIFETMLDLATEYGCAVRWPLAEGSNLADVVAGLPASLAGEMESFAPRLLADRRIPHPDHLVTGFYDESATLDALLGILRALPEGVSEIMCHPGHADAELLAESGYARQRERELAVLTDPQAQAAVAEQNVQLITFALLDSPPGIRNS